MPDCEQILLTGTKYRKQNSVSVEQIQDAHNPAWNRTPEFAGKILIFPQTLIFWSKFNKYVQYPRKKLNTIVLWWACTFYWRNTPQPTLNIYDHILPKMNIMAMDLFDNLEKSQNNRIKIFDRVQTQ